MGFPNVDIFLQDKLHTRLAAIKASPALIINDLFEDLPAPIRVEITNYVTRKMYVKDLNDRKPSAVYILPHHPMLDMPLPQIGISLGNENPSERFLDDNVGDALPYPDENNITHWDIPKGYWASATYQIDVVAATKPETIWLSKIIQRIILEEQDALDQIGVKEINLSLQDMRLASEHAPMTVFNRQIQMTCKVANTWIKRIAASNYAEGLNTAL